MKRILYLDASSGVAGDMFVGALLDLGADFEAVRRDVRSLGVAGLEVRARKVTRRGLSATKFDVLDTHTGDAPDGPPARRHSHHPHRRLRDIRALLAGSDLPASVAASALGIFEHLAEAEGRVHGEDPADVHFHEVGALDAIADVVAAASAFHQLRVDEAWCSTVHVGFGTVRCAHGVLPIPAPATAELLKGLPTRAGPVQGELATPTGAALLRHFCSVFSDDRPGLASAVTGCGAGTKDFGVPNVLRATLGIAAGVGDKIAAQRDEEPGLRSRGQGRQEGGHECP